MNFKKYQNLIFLLLLATFFCLQFHNLIFAMPSGIHEWAQGDRLALAYGFYDNGMNFFKPSTLSQFSKDGITGVEFPLQPYIAAVLAKIFGRNHLSILYRLLDTSIIYICLYQLFRITSSFTKQFMVAALPIVALLLSPCFLSYTCNYMPDTVSVSINLLGMGLYLQCWIQNKHHKRYWALLWFTLATLIKTSSALYFIGFVSYDLYLLFIKPSRRAPLKTVVPYLMGILCAISIITGYLVYNQYLNQRYNSTLFLLNIRPISAKDAAYFIFHRFPATWMREYFIIPAYLFLLCLGIPVYYNKQYRSMILLLHAILAIGIIAISYLMGAQFIDHDYYIIPIVFPFIILHLCWLAIINPKWLYRPIMNNILSMVVVLLLVISYIKTQDRLSPQYRDFSTYYNTDWVKNGASTLNKLSISHKEKIVVLNENPPNLSLVYLDRKGYVLSHDWWGGQVESAYNFFEQNGISYGVCKRAEYDKITASGQDFLHYFQLMYTDKDMVVFRKKSAKTPL